MIKGEYFAYNTVMLKMQIPKYYQVKKGQTIAKIAEAFCLPPTLIVRENRLKEEVFEGQILQIPEVRGNLYSVRIGDDKNLLCGSEEKFREKNGTNLLFPYQNIFL